MFALADGNNFFASCERVFRPDLESCPVLVLSNNDGCVIARSAEVKALGVQMGVPWFQVKDLCKKKGVAVFSSNFRLYGDMSGRMMNVLAQYARDLAPYSIDEAFLDIGDGDLATLESHMRDARAQVKKQTGLPVSIGIAPTKVLAKAANRWAKKSTATGGVFALYDGNREQVLHDMMAGDLWGIGSQLAHSLHDMGIQTALDLANADPTQMRRRFNVYMQRMVLELRGEPCFGLEEGLAKYPTIQATRSFGKPVTDLHELEEAVATYTSRAAVKLRERNLLAQTILVYIKTNKHRPELPQHVASQTVALPHATSDTTLMVTHARQALRQVYQKGFAYKKAGVWLGELMEAGELQHNLFSPDDTSESQKLMAVMDKLNHRYGQGTLQAAMCGLQPKWTMRSANRSPDYTTAWGDVVTAWAR
ncbi:MAG TPA: Y-family DNA polymerase [Alphaproteobacteria bacterium]|nr:Y-family DNA polymerase [Alphaproteobacteria bacterium]